MNNLPEKKTKVISERELTERLEAWFAAGCGEFPLRVTGHSMTPFVAPERDTAFLYPVSGKIKKGDVILFESESGRLLLHRVIKAGENIVTAGDAYADADRGGVKKIYAVCRKIKRKNKIHKENGLFWFFFSKIWTRLVPARGVILRLWAGLS